MPFNDCELEAFRGSFDEAYCTCTNGTCGISAADLFALISRFKIFKTSAE
jgi:hypothetical protein